MKKYLKRIIQPLFLGFAFYIFIYLGMNSELIAHDAVKTYTTIFAGALFTFLIVYAVIDKRVHLNIAGFGFVLANVLFAIIIPIILIVNTIIFKKPNEKPAKSIVEEFVSISTDCFEIKYGTFTNGIDTLKRYGQGNLDFEIRKINGLDEQRHRIKWMDSCSYLRLDKNNTVLDVVKLGNIDSHGHQMVEQPGSSNSFDQKQIPYWMTIK